MSANEEMYGVCYRTGAPDVGDYDEAIIALRNAREALLSGDSSGCRVCEDSGHGANMCHHNPLLLARKWASATNVWQCWHCGFVATNAEEAREHFGLHEAELPTCEVDRRAAPRFKEALRQWLCPSCGGAGTYKQRGRGIVGGWVMVTCKVCEGTRLHPTALRALGADR